MEFFATYIGQSIVELFGLVYVLHIILKYSYVLLCILDTFQDFLIAEHMKSHMHILKISISSLNHVIVRPTKTPKLADKKCA